MEQNDIEALQLGGLSLNQAKVYLALLSTGESTIKAIAKVAAIDRANTSRALAALERLALVKKTLAIPSIYEALSINDTIDILLEMKNKELEQLQNTSKGLLDKFHSFSSPKTPSENEFVIVRKTASIKFTISLWQGAEHTIDVISSARREMASPSIFIPEAKNALQRGITIRSIQDLKLGSAYGTSVIPKKNSCTKLFSIPLWEERYSENSSVIGAIFDKKICTFVADPLSAFPKSSCIITNNKGFIDMLQFYFDGLWATAKRSSE